SHDRAPEPVDLPVAGQRHKFHRSLLPRFEPYRRTGGDVQTEAARPRTVEAQRTVDLREVIVRSHLNRPVAPIDDVQGHHLAPDVQFEVAGFDQDFARDHATTDNTATP